MEIHKTVVESNCLDVSDKAIIRVTDEQAKLLMKKILKCEDVASFQNLDTIKKEKCLRKLRENGVSIRQLSRLTAISVGIIRKVS